MEVAHPKNARMPDSTWLIILHYHRLITFTCLPVTKGLEQKNPVSPTAWGEMLVIRQKITTRGVCFYRGHDHMAHLLLQ